MTSVAICHPQVTGLTHALAAYSAAISMETLPQDVIAIARCCALDWLGVTIAGSREPLMRILRAEADEAGGHPQAAVIGGGRTSVVQAALLNGTASHALDYDDVHLAAMIGHPSVVVMPAILALAERDGRDGSALIAAFSAGVEAQCRVGLLMGPSHYERGWHTTGTVGALGAAAAAANMLGLNACQTAHAFGIAASQAAGLKANFGTMCKPLHAGKAAANGLYAALLARRGFTSRCDILECDQGFGDTQSDDRHSDRALDGIGSTFHTRDILFKYHASCYSTHAPIEAAHAIRKEHGITPDQVDQVEIRVAPPCLRICNIQNPATALETKFSLRFTVAMALSGKNTSAIDAYNDAACSNPILVGLRDRGRVVSDERLEQAQAEVVVTISDGAVLRQRADVGVPMTDHAEQWRRLVDKFRQLAAPVIGVSKVESMIEQVHRLENLKNLRDIVAMCGD